MSGPASIRERDCYVCKQPFAKVHRYYDSMCESCGDFNYAKREQTADLSGQYALITGARVKIGYQAVAQTTARRGACHRHDALSGRCRRSLFERAGFLFVSGAAADPRAGSASHAERGAVHEISRRAAAAPRLHPQQRVPDGASAGGILSTPAGAGSRSRSPRFRRTCDACSRVTTSCARCSKGRARTPRRAGGDRNTARARGSCTAQPSRSDAIWTRTTAAARRSSPRIASTRTGSKSTCAR